MFFSDKVSDSKSISYEEPQKVTRQIAQEVSFEEGT